MLYSKLNGAHQLGCLDLFVCDLTALADPTMSQFAVSVIAIATNTRSAGSFDLHGEQFN